VLLCRTDKEEAGNVEYFALGFFLCARAIFIEPFLLGFIVVSINHGSDSMNKLFFTIFLLLTIPFAQAAKPLAERLLMLNTDVNYDEEYNKALDEMQSLPAPEKEKLSKELSKTLTGDKIADRRANAASALGDMCASVKGNVQHLKQSAKDKEKIVRQATVSALKRCGKSPEAVEVLKTLKNDADEVVKLQVQMALEEWK